MAAAPPAQDRELAAVLQIVGEPRAIDVIGAFGVKLGRHERAAACRDLTFEGPCHLFAIGGRGATAAKRLMPVEKA